VTTRRTFAAGLGAAALPGIAGAQSAAPLKLAVIIANGDYDADGRADASEMARQRAQERGFVGDLPNTWFDGVRIGEALKRAGYDVDTVQNALPVSMLGAVHRMAARARTAGGAAQCVVYYAGHGVQLGGRSYLVGVGAQLIADEMAAETAEDRMRIGLRIGAQHSDLVAALPPARAPGFNLMLIDACRDNPWEPQIRAAVEAQGRAYVGERAFAAMSPPPRTVIGFSTQPGQTAADGRLAAGSPFANAIARRIVQPGMTVDSLVSSATGEVAGLSGAMQMPWVSGRLGDGTRLT